MLLKDSVLLRKEGGNIREVQEDLGWNYGPSHPSSVALDKLLNALSLTSHICKMGTIKLRLCICVRIGNDVWHFCILLTNMLENVLCARLRARF